MSFFKILVVGVVVASLLLVLPVFFIYMASDTQTNIAVEGSYGPLWDFQNSMNYLIATILSNLGYVLAIMIIVGMFIAAIGFVVVSR